MLKRTDHKILPPNYGLWHYGTEKHDPFHFGADPSEQLFGQIREFFFSWLYFSGKVITKLADFQCWNICSCYTYSVLVSNFGASLCISSTRGSFLPGDHFVCEGNFFF